MSGPPLRRYGLRRAARAKKAIKIEATGGMLIWGAGPTMIFPTASEAVLGTGKFSLGPAAVVGYLGPEWSVGLFPQHCGPSAATPSAPMSAHQYSVLPLLRSAPGIPRRNGASA